MKIANFTLLRRMIYSLSLVFVSQFYALGNISSFNPPLTSPEEGISTPSDLTHYSLIANCQLSTVNLLLIANCPLPTANCSLPTDTTPDKKRDRASRQLLRGKEWVSLFNGKNLDGWLVKIKGYNLNDNPANTFYVKDGKMKVQYQPDSAFNDKFGHIFYKTPFSHYLFAVEYRFVGKQAKDGPAWAYKNSGIMVHCQAPETMLKDQDFPISVEVQLLGGDSTGERSTCNVCTPGTNIVMDGKLETKHCINSSSKTFRNDEWVRAEVLVLGDSIIRHIVNGDTVLTYTKPQIGEGAVSNYDPAIKVDGQLLSSGYISLQSESHPIEFRKIEIIDLSGEPTKKRSRHR
jgi:hypothetical protein